VFYSFTSEIADLGQILLQSGLRTVLLGDVYKQRMLYTLDMITEIRSQITPPTPTRVAKAHWTETIWVQTPDTHATEAQVPTLTTARSTAKMDNRSTEPQL